MELFSFLLVSFIVYGVAALSAAGSDEAPPIPTVSNTRAFTGNGCPPETVSSYTSQMDPTTGLFYVTNSLDKLMPYTGPGTSINDRTKKCTISFNITVPEGWKLRVNNNGTEFMGYLRLTSTDTARLKVEYVVSPENPSSISETLIKGPMNNRFSLQRSTPNNGAHVSLCGGGTLNATYRLSITSSSSKDHGWLGDPDDSELVWTLRTTVEVVKC